MLCVILKIWKVEHRFGEQWSLGDHSRYRESPSRSMGKTAFNPLDCRMTWKE